MKLSNVSRTDLTKTDAGVQKEGERDIEFLSDDVIKSIFGNYKIYWDILNEQHLKGLQKLAFWGELSRRY